MTQDIKPTSSRPALHRVSALCVATLLALAAGVARADDISDVQQLIKSGQHAEAQKKLDLLLSVKPKDAQLRFLKGVSLAEQSRGAEAVAVFVKLTEDYPELPEPYNNLAVLYAGQGQYDKARTALEMSIRTNPSYATAYENLGDVYAKLASQAYAKALQVDSTNPAVAPKLAMIRDLFGTKPASSAPPAPSLAATVAAAKPAVVATAASASTAATPSAAAPKPAASAPATTAVAAAPATAPAAAAAPAVAGGTDARREVQAAVQAWAQAWSRKDLQAYFASYANGYGAGKGAREWQDDRRARIMGKNSISVALSGMVVEVNGTRATASFRQDYAADALRVSSRKTLSLVRQGDKWVIDKESVGS